MSHHTHTHQLLAMTTDGLTGWSARLDVHKTHGVMGGGVSGDGKCVISIQMS